jgi:TetR/AcrR family transcriptional regulator
MAKGDPRQRILDAATRVFARKGYSASGVREIAAEAKVNLAMVSYYFGGKAGLFEAILTHFFDTVGKTAQEVLAVPATHPEERLATLVRVLLARLRQDPEVIRIALTELPLELPHIASFKASMLRTLVVPVMQEVISAFSGKRRRAYRMEMIGPALGSLLMFHFLMRPVIRQVFQVQFDDRFYEDFGNEITEFLLYGFIGLPPAAPSVTPHEERRS